MGIVSILDGREPDAAVMISHASVVATEGGPLVVWRREERASETGAVTLSQPGAEAIELDRGEVDDARGGRRVGGSFHGRSGRPGALAVQPFV